MAIAETIAKALGGRTAGRGWTARCPAHDDRTPSLSIRDAGGKVLVRCHAGCEQESVIAELRRRGLWAENGKKSRSCTVRRLAVEREPDQEQSRRSEGAVAIWRSAKSAQGTHVSSYLASRGIELRRPTRCASMSA